MQVQRRYDIRRIVASRVLGGRKDILIPAVDHITVPACDGIYDHAARQAGGRGNQRRNRDRADFSGQALNFGKTICPDIGVILRGSPKSIKVTRFNGDVSAKDNGAEVVYFVTFKF